MPFYLKSNPYQGVVFSFSKTRFCAWRNQKNFSVFKFVKPFLEKSNFRQSQQQIYLNGFPILFAFLFRQKFTVSGKFLKSKLQRHFKSLLCRNWPLDFQINLNLTPKVSDVDS